MKLKSLKIASFLITIFLTSGICFGQTSVPNTDTFSLQDVYNAVHAHTSGTQTNLQSCFDNAISGYFDPNYNTNSYAPANSMLRFRNYHPSDPCSYPISSFMTSSEGACVSYNISSVYTAKQAIALEIYWNSGVRAYDPNCTAGGGGAYAVKMYLRTVGQSAYYTSGSCLLYNYTLYAAEFESGTSQSGGYCSGCTAYIVHFTNGVMDSKEAFNQTWPYGLSYSSYSNKTQTSITLNCTVTNDGGNSITERGVYYSSTVSNPTVSNSKATNGTGTGSFSVNISGLTAGTTYYFRPYATNEWGTSYGTSNSFTTLP